jgi:hypothetical protein
LGELTVQIMLSLLLLPFKILKFIVVSALKVFVFVLICIILINVLGLGDYNVHSFQEGPRTERNHTARC